MWRLKCHFIEVKSKQQVRELLPGVKLRKARRLQTANFIHRRVKHIALFQTCDSDANVARLTSSLVLIWTCGLRMCYGRISRLAAPSWPPSERSSAWSRTPNTSPPVSISSAGRYKHLIDESRKIADEAMKKEERAESHGDVLEKNMESRDLTCDHPR